VVRSALVVEPGVGHLACYLRSCGKAVIDLCSRDALALAASRANLALASKVAADNDTGKNYPFLQEISDATYDLLLALPEIIPGVDQSAWFWDQASRLLRPGATLIVALGSTFFDRFEKKKPRGYVKLREKKRKGHVTAAWRYEGIQIEDGQA
jgi:hypothetical protein